MFARYALTALAVASGAMAQALTINSPPSLIEPSLIQWQGGQGPYFISIIPGGQPSAAPLIDFGEQTGNQLTWTVNVTAGTKLTYKVKDQTGTENFNSEVTVTAGSSKDCLNSAGTVVTGSGAAASASATMAGVASSASGAASSPVNAVSSAAASASSMVASASSAAGSAVSSARASGSASGNAVSSASSAAAGASSAAASAAPSGAASLNLASKGGVVAMIVGVVGAALF